jgi:hypothetical protein
LGSLAILGPNVGAAQYHISAGLRFFERAYAATLLRTEIGFDHSLFTLVKLPVVLINGYAHHLVVASQTDGGHGHLGDAAAELLQASLKLYFGWTALLGVLVYFFWIRKLPMVNQVLALSVCAVLLPPVSYDYTLVHLFMPFALMCLYATDLWRKGEEVQGLKTCFACFAVIFTAEAYFTVVIRFSGQIRAIALLILLIVVLRQRFPWTELGESVERRTQASTAC